jgi:hypothetical protein
MSNAPIVGAGVWKLNYAAVRKAMIEVIHSVVEYEGRRCNIELLITPLNVLAGVDGNEQYISFNKDMLKTAFKNTDSIDYFADCEGDLSTAFKGTLHIRIGKGKKGVADIGLFRNKTDARRGMANVSNDKAEFASEHLFRKLPRTYVPSDGLKEGLKVFLREMKVNRDRAAAKAASGRLEKEKKDNKRKATEISRMTKDDPVEDENETENSNTINIDSVKSSIVEQTLELNELDDKIDKLVNKQMLARKSIQADIKYLRSLEGVDEADNHVDDYDMDCNDDDDDDDDDTNNGEDSYTDEDIDRINKSLNPETNNTVLYNYCDEVGRMEYNQEHGLIERDLIKGLIDAKSREQVSSGKVKPYKFKYILRRCGKRRLCWVPASHDLLHTNKIDGDTPLLTRWRYASCKGVCPLVGSSHEDNVIQYKHCTFLSVHAVKFE